MLRTETPTDRYLRYLREKGRCLPIYEVVNDPRPILIDAIAIEMRRGGVRGIHRLIIPLWCGRGSLAGR